MDFMLLFGPAFVLMLIVATDHWRETRPPRRRRLTRYKSPLPSLVDRLPPASGDRAAPGPDAAETRLAQSGMKP